MTDAVNQPAHYTAGGIETIDVIEQVFGKVDHRDQVEKYNQRAHHKGSFKQDLEKARWYLNRTIENCEKGLLDPLTGGRVTPEAQEEEPWDRVAQHLPVKDRQGDVWVWSEEELVWHWYFIDNGVVTSKSSEWADHVVQSLTEDFFQGAPSDMEIDAVAKYNESMTQGVFQDLHTKVLYWIKEESGWRYFVVSDGVCRYASSGGFQSPTTQSVKLSDTQAHRIRSIIAEGVFV